MNINMISLSMSLSPTQWQHILLLAAGSTTGSSAGTAMNTLASLGTLQGLTGTSLGLNLNALTNSVSGKKNKEIYSPLTHGCTTNCEIEPSLKSVG